MASVGIIKPNENISQSTSKEKYGILKAIIPVSGVHGISGTGINLCIFESHDKKGEPVIFFLNDRSEPFRSNILPYRIKELSYFTVNFIDGCEEYLIELVFEREYFKLRSVTTNLDLKLFVDALKAICEKNSPNCRILWNCTPRRDSNIYEAEFISEDTIINKELDKIVIDCESSILKIGEFVDKISNSYDLLKQKNFDELLKSEQSFSNMSGIIDKSLEDVEKIQKFIDSYDSVIINIKSKLEEFQILNSSEIKQQNLKILTDALGSIIEKLNLSEEDVYLLLNSDVCNPSSEFILALEKLVNAFKANLPPGTKRMFSVQSQLKNLEEIRQSATTRFSKELKSFINSKVSDHSLKNSSLLGMSVPSHSKFHLALNSVSPIMKCLKILNALIFSDIYSGYNISVQKLYQTEFQEYIDEKIKLLFSSLIMLEKPENFVYECKESLRKLTAPFNETFCDILDLIKNGILSECSFGDSFFWFSAEISDDVSRRKKSQELSNVIENRTTSSDLKIRGMLQQIFGFLSDKIVGILEECFKYNPYFIFLVVRIFEERISSYKSNDFYSFWLNNILKDSLSFSNKVFEMLGKSIDDGKVIRKAKQNCADVTKRIVEFILSAEIIFEGVQTNSQIIEGYKEAINKLLLLIEKFCNDSDMSVLQKDALRIEYLHTLQNEVLSIRVPELANQKKGIKNLYQNCTQEFALSISGRPFGKLYTLIEEYETKIRDGMTNHAVCTAISNDKPAFKKALKDFNLKEITKNYESIIAKTEKYFPDISYMSVVKSSIQKQFLQEFEKISHFFDNYLSGILQINLDVTRKDIEVVLASRS